MNTTDTYDPPLTKNLPHAGGKAWRPWGYLRNVSVAGSSDPAEYNAVVTTPAVTRDTITTRQWDNAMTHIAGTPLTQPRWFGAIVGAGIGAVLIYLTVAVGIPQPPAFLYIPVLVIIGFLGSYVAADFVRKRNAQAAEELFYDDGPFNAAVLGLGRFDTRTSGIGQLIADIDAIGFEYERGNVSDTAWQTAHGAVLAAVVDIAAGAQPDSGSYAFSTAQTVLNQTRDTIGRAGRID